MILDVGDDFMYSNITINMRKKTYSTNQFIIIKDAMVSAVFL